MDSSAFEPYLLTVPGCTPLCPLDRFVQLTQSVISEDVKKECLLESSFANEIPTLGNQKLLNQKSNRN